MAKIPVHLKPYALLVTVPSGTLQLLEWVRQIATVAACESLRLPHKGVQHREAVRKACKALTVALHALAKAEAMNMEIEAFDIAGPPPADPLASTAYLAVRLTAVVRDLISGEWTRKMRDPHFRRLSATLRTVRTAIEAFPADRELEAREKLKRKTPTKISKRPKARELDPAPRSGELLRR